MQSSEKHLLINHLWETEFKAWYSCPLENGLSPFEMVQNKVVFYISYSRSREQYDHFLNHLSNLANSENSLKSDDAKKIKAKVEKGYAKFMQCMYDLLLAKYSIARTTFYGSDRKHNTLSENIAEAESELLDIIQNYTF